ncbi:MAG: PCP reductase family protein, partial [Candidatus Rokuibacteriota bacterium]
DKAVVDALARQEGALEEEETFDGVRLTWTEEAKRLLRTVPSGYERRRARARMEKSARVRRLDTITKDLATAVIEEDAEERRVAPMVRAPVVPPAVRPDDPFVWTEEAAARLQRVPAGFMRDITRSRIEAVARERGTTRIDLELAEAGIEVGKQIMNEVVASYSRGGPEQDVLRQSPQGNNE